MPGTPSPPQAADYPQWLAQLKTSFWQVQLKAAVAVNVELLQFYWQLGADIAAQQAEQRWGTGFLQRLSQDLMQEFPQVKGFSSAIWSKSAAGTAFGAAIRQLRSRLLRNCSAPPGGTTC